MSILSSRGGLVVSPGSVFVVLGAGFEAAVKDADKPGRELAQGGVVADLPGRMASFADPPAAADQSLPEETPAGLISTLATLRSHLDDGETDRLAAATSLATRLLAEYGDRAALFDTTMSLADQELVARRTGRRSSRA